MWCRLGFHHWRAYQAIWRMEYAALKLEVRICRRCQHIHTTDQAAMHDIEHQYVTYLRWPNTLIHSLEPHHAPSHP